MSVLTSAPNVGKIAWRDALVKEVCWLTGSTAEAKIPPGMRKRPGQFFEMWEKLRGKAQMMIAAQKGQPKNKLFTMDDADQVEEALDPGVPEASGSTESKDKLVLVSLMEKDKIVKSKRMRISAPLGMASLRASALSTFGSSKNSDLAFEVFDVVAQDTSHLLCMYRHESMCHIVCFGYFGLI